jgi:integrase/recombinase XerD
MPRRGSGRLPNRVSELGPGGMGGDIAEFLEWMRTHNFSERTVENRELSLCQMACWLEERGLSRPQEVTRPVLERYQRWLFHYRKQNGQPMSFMAQQGRLTAVRTFFRWLAKQNRILYNPASELEMPKVERRLPKHVLTAREVELVLQRPDVGTPFGVRDRAMMEVFYSTGIRRMELANLGLYDLDSERGTLIVRQGKGKKDRMVPIGERAAAWVRRYVEEVRPMLVLEPDCGTLFLTKEGRSFASNLNHLSQVVRDHVLAAAVGKSGSCHLFRHTMATLMLEGGADIRYVQQMLGHADISTTQIYTQVSIRKLQQIHLATHPAARLGRNPDRDREELGALDEHDRLLLSLAAEATEEEEALASG